MVLPYTQNINIEKSIDIIAEVGQAHDGSLGMLHAYIDAVAKTGANVIKFQTHIAQAESSEAEPFRVQFSRQDANRKDYWHRMSFSKHQWLEIREHCEQVGLEFMSTPFSNQAIELLESVGVRRYKVGSGDLRNFLLLDKIQQTNKPILLSTGMANFDEIESTLSYLQGYSQPITLMQCTTQYPTPLQAVGLNVLKEYQQRFSVPVGLSDHSGTVYPSILAASIGAIAVEVHVVFDKRMFGPDVSSSLTIEQLKDLVDHIRANQVLLNTTVDKRDNQAYADLQKVFGRSLAVNKSLPEGHCIEFEDLEALKPAEQGVAVQNYRDVIGKRLTKTKKAFEFLLPTDFQAPIDLQESVDL